MSENLKYRSKSTRRFFKKHSINSADYHPMPEMIRLDRELDIIKGSRPKASLKKLAECSEHFLRMMPKADLHLHSTAMADIFETATLAWNMSNKSDKGLQKLAEYKGSLDLLIENFLHPQPGNLQDYLKRYDLLKNYLIQDLETIEYHSYIGAKQAFDNGVCLLEIRTSIKAGALGDPRSKDVMSGIAFSAKDEIFARVKGFRQAERESKGRLKVYLLISFRRQDSLKNSKSLLKEVLVIKRELEEKFGREYIIGVDIAGQEYRYKARKFEPVFREARSKGLKVTAHAGEEQGAGEGSIWQAINSGAQRIGHGTSLYLPTPMLPKSVRHTSHGYKKNAFIASLMFGCAYEMCLTSNVICGAQVTVGYKPNKGNRPIPIVKVMDDPNDYPALPIFALGSLFYHGRSQVLPIPCTDGIYTLNTDLPREYALASGTFDLGLKEILALARYSIRHSFAPAEDKAQALKQWREFAASYLTDPRYSSPDEESKKALHNYRLEIRRKLGVTSEVVEAILQEVHSSKRYLSGYLYERFHRQSEVLQV